MSTCNICGSADTSVHYRGKIRVGPPGNYTGETHNVLRCGACDVRFLQDPPSMNYDDADYRTLVDGDASVDRFYALHDGEQADKLPYIDMKLARRGTVADVGCGAGSFLDLLAGVATTTIAIEPTRTFHDELRNKNHRVYPYCADAIAEWEKQIDVVTCFSVIEHLDNPLATIKEMRALLRPGGKLVISTPNAADWLLENLGDAYQAFFYRSVHQWYFTAESLRVLGERAGFTDVAVAFKHRFDLSNALLWLRDRQPTGIARMPIPDWVSAPFVSWLEQTGGADYLYATMTAA